MQQSLLQSIVRWDHIVMRWIDGGMQGCLMLQSMLAQSKMAQEAVQNAYQTPEEFVSKHVTSLILKLFSLFIPHGLKFFVQNAQCILPTNEIQLCRQTLDIFVALLQYNRSLACL